MAIAAILDPMCKMRVINYCFPLIYPPHKVQVNISKVRQILYDMYDEYVEMHVSSSSGCSSSSVTHLLGMSQFLSHITTIESVQAPKNNLDNYFENGLLTGIEDSNMDTVNLDVLKR